MAARILQRGGPCFSRIILETKNNSLISKRVAHRSDGNNFNQSKYMTAYRDVNSSIETHATAKDFVYTLNKQEREILWLELEKHDQAMKDVPGAGRFSKPTWRQLLHVAFINGLPFVGFGFLDNAIMIIAGESIELTIGQRLQISSFAAASLGNWLSDVAGLQFKNQIEGAINSLGFKPATLSPEQLEMKSVKKTGHYGQLVGLTIGCFLGMLPLLFFTPKT